MTERNKKIMALVSSGSTYQQAADAVGVTRNTVAGVVYRERRKLYSGDLFDMDTSFKVVPIASQPKPFLRRVFDRVMGRT